MAKMIAKPEELTRSEIRAVLRRHRGEKVKIANELGLKFPAPISDFLYGRGRSKRVEEAVRKRAAELINAERAAQKGGSA